MQDYKGSVPGFEPGQPTPKSSLPAITKETGISLALVLAIAAGVYNFAFMQGKNEGRDRDLIEVRGAMEKMKEQMKALEINQIQMCAAIKGCQTRR